MKTRNQFFGLIAIVAIIAIIALSMAGCEKEDDPVLCKCPNGTLHLVGETCCDGTDCKCEKNVVGQRVQGIPVTSRGGDHTKAIANVTTAFGYLSPDEVTILKNNVIEIKVTSSGTARPTYPKVNGKYVIEIRENSPGADIHGYALDAVLYDISTR